MADKDGAGENASRESGKPVKKKRRPLSYFYLNGLLHKSLHISRGADTITAWCYPEHRRIAYTYSDVLKRKENAFTTAEVCKMVQRRRGTVENAILEGHIEEPQSTYGLSSGIKFKYMWAEKDIMALHAYLSTVHFGRPRKDGLITPMRLPTARELRAMVRHNEIMYVKRDGKFIPTFDAEDM